jgi:hypothetical protein
MILATFLTTALISILPIWIAEHSQFYSVLIMRTTAWKSLISKRQKGKTARGWGQRHPLYLFLLQVTEYPKWSSSQALGSSVYLGGTKFGLASTECVVQV